MNSIFSIPSSAALLNVSSTAFSNEEYIPKKYTCQGKNVNPPLTISNIPAEAKSLVLIVDDPDAPVRTWVHWVVWNIGPVKEIKENSVPGIEGINDFNQHHYGGPSPPCGTHRYFFKVYALNDLLSTYKNIRKSDLEKIMNPHIIGYGELIGLYKKT